MTDTGGGVIIDICAGCAAQVRDHATAGGFVCVFCGTDERPSRSTGLVFECGDGADVCDSCRATLLIGEQPLEVVGNE